MQTPPPASAPAPLRVIHDRTVIIARRDDHNPFFQLSGVLNAWMLTRTLGWNRNDTRVIFMDGGFPSPIDDLHYRLLSTPDKFSLLRGGEHLLGHKFKFTNDVMFAPYETTGPLMQHLNDEEPCQRSQLITEFRADALAAMGIPTPDPSTKKAITVTIISRRNYGGRRVQRRWLNEDEVLAAMREKYPSFNGMPIVIQSLEFVDLTLEQQMEISLNSDVVIGMHGAGMVNVLWTRPGTLVIEIFPRFRYRWGYRNICQYIGCDWHEFRGGGDTGMGDNASHKTIYVDPWLAFFDPLFRKQIGMPLADAAASVSNAENASTTAPKVERSRAMRSPFFQP
jgi:glycoprotein 2-beta-D-xylosyltransferase